MLVTVVIPTYNRLKILKDALLSVKSQSYTNFECIVVNDCPTKKEEVKEVIEGIEDIRFRVVHHEQNMGLAKTRNTGIRAAKGEIITFLDDDDTWEKNFLQMHVSKHTEHKDVGLVYCAFYKVWQDNLRPKELYLDNYPSCSLPYAMIKGMFYTSNGSILSFKRKCFDEVGLFDSRCESFEDWDMVFRISQHFKIIQIVEPLANYSIHFKERLTTSVDKRLRAYLAVKEKYQFGSKFNKTIYSFLIMDYYRFIRDSVILGKRNKAVSTFLNLLFTQNLTWLFNLKTTVKIALIVVFGKPSFKLMKHL